MPLHQIYLANEFSLLPDTPDSYNGESGKIPTVNATEDALEFTSAGAGSGDVTSALIMTDNALVKADGGAKGIQDSGIIISDTDFVSGATIKSMKISDGIDLTKLIDFSAVGVTTGTTRVVTFPDSNITLIGKDSTETQTNKTFTAPVINTPTGIVKADVGLGSVDNTSDATKNSAVATLTNKTITTPTGLVKSDVGLGNVDNTSDSTKNSATATFTNKRITKRVQTVVSSATVTPNSNSDDFVEITAQAVNLTIANPSGTPTNGQQIELRMKDNGTTRTFSFGTQYLAIDTLPTTSTVSKWHYFVLVYDSAGTKWHTFTKVQV